VERLYPMSKQPSSPNESGQVLSVASTQKGETFNGAAIY